MDILSDFRSAVQSDLNVGSESTLYSTTTIDLAINRAYLKAAGLFPWTQLEEGKKTPTVVGHEYYDYPTNWRSNSIWKIVINGERWGNNPDGSPLSFDDYQNWKTDYPDNTDKKWANFGRQFFIYPVPTVADLDICIWGKKVTASLSSDSSTTIFSYNSPACNEAIVLEAEAILKSQGENDKGAEFKSVEAKQILAVEWGKIRQELAKYEKDQPMFEVPNFFSGTGNGVGEDMRGRFDI